MRERERVENSFIRLNELVIERKKGERDRVEKSFVEQECESGRELVRERERERERES